MLAQNFSSQTRLEALVTLGIVLIVVVFMNIIPWLSIPFRRLNTMIHEFGHAVATIATGGTSKGFWVYLKPKEDERGIKYGEAKRAGGNDYYVIPAGYLGATLFSVGLILLSALPYLAPIILGALGILLILIAIDFGRSCFTRLLGLAFGIVFIFVAWQADLLYGQSFYCILWPFKAVSLHWTKFVDPLATQFRWQKSSIVSHSARTCFGYGVGLFFRFYF